MAVDASIRRDVPIPYYYQLMQVLQSEIESGSRPADSAIPSEHELCRMFNVSRTVVRQALGDLVAKGLLYRVKGKGTFVAPSKLNERFVQRSDGFYGDMTSRGFSVRSSVLEQCVAEPPSNVRDHLGPALSGLVIKIERLRFVNEEPMQLVTTYIPHDLCPDLVAADLTTCSLYDLLRTRYSLTVASGTRVLEAVLAQRPICTLLGVNKGAPLLKMESVSYLRDGRPLEYYIAWHRGDRSKFEIEMMVGANVTVGQAPTRATRGNVRR